MQKNVLNQKPTQNGVFLPLCHIVRRFCHIVRWKSWQIGVNVLNLYHYLTTIKIAMINYYYIRTKNAIFSDADPSIKKAIEEMSVRNAVLICSLHNKFQSPPIWDRKTKTVVRTLSGTEKIMPELTEKVRRFVDKDEIYYKKIDELKAI